jgi:pyridoxine kinase
MKQVVVLNDIAGIAACTLGVSLPILSICDCKVYPMPTAVFSSSTRVEGVQFSSMSDFLPKVAAHWASIDFAPDAVLTGCFADDKGIDAVLPVVKQYRDNNALIMVDPVMGDEGRVFASEAHQAAMRRLAALADIICPNFTEFCVLCGADYEALEQLPYAEKMAFLRGHVEALGVKKVVVTGIRNGEEVSNYAYDEGKIDIYTHPFHHQSVCGTGDMFSNIVLARCLWGQTLADSVKYAGKWIEDLAKNMPEHPERGLYIGGKRLMALRENIL